MDFKLESSKLIAYIYTINWKYFFLLWEQYFSTTFQIMDINNCTFLKKNVSNKSAAKTHIYLHGITPKYCCY